MSIYRVNPVGSGGFKVDVVEESGGLRVVGVFLTEADANVWIAADQNGARSLDDDGSRLVHHQEK
jgi:hypothetical protein